MTTALANTYRGARLVFIVAVCLMWFLLLWGLGYMVATKLPGDGAISFKTAFLFFAVGFFPILCFGAPGTLIGFLHRSLEDPFELPPQSSAPSPPLLWRAGCHNNPWLLGLNRLLLVWVPAVLMATGLLWVFFADGISPSAVALLLGALGAALVAMIAAASTGRPFLCEARLTPEKRRWQGSFPAYLLWRHGIPWGLGNGALNAVLAIPLFPVTPGADPGLATAFMVSVDVFSTAVILCFFMAVSAYPHALVDGRLGVIRPPRGARSPGRAGRISLLLLGCVAVALVTGLILKLAGVTWLSLGEFIVVKAILATGIAGAAAMVVAYWTLARENLTGTLSVQQAGG